MSVLAAFLAVGVPAPVARREAPLAEAAMIEFSITTQARARDFLANVLHESGGLRWFEEIADGSAYEGRCVDLGNCQRGDGRRYKGRGPIQLTGRANYVWASKQLGINLIVNPRKAAEHRIGWRIAGLYWRSRGLNGLADRGEFKQICIRINGGLNGYHSQPGGRLWYRARLRNIDCRPRNRWAGYTAAEQRWIKEFDRLPHGAAHAQRRRVLRIRMRQQCEAIERAARPKSKGGDGRGWKHANRAKRHRSLRARGGAG